VAKIDEVIIHCDEVLDDGGVGLFYFDIGNHVDAIKGQ